MSGDIPPIPNTPSRCGAQFKRKQGDNFTFYLILNRWCINLYTDPNTKFNWDLFSNFGYKTSWRMEGLTHHPTYKVVTKSFRTGRLERELQMVQLSATRCSCMAILWVSLVSFAAITLCVCFSTSVYCCKRIFRYRISPETFGYTHVCAHFVYLNLQQTTWKLQGSWLVNFSKLNIS
jgi:hypothetical protein